MDRPSLFPILKYSHLPTQYQNPVTKALPTNDTRSPRRNHALLYICGVSQLHSAVGKLWVDVVGLRVCRLIYTVTQTFIWLE